MELCVGLFTVVGQLCWISPATGGLSFNDRLRDGCRVAKEIVMLVTIFNKVGIVPHGNTDVRTSVL